MSVTTEDGATVDVGDPVWWVEKDHWWCDIDKMYKPADKLEHGTVVSVGGNGNVGVSWERFRSGRESLVSVFPASELYVSRHAAEKCVRPTEPECNR